MSRARDKRAASSSAGSDISALFVVCFAVGPFLLPALGVDLSDVAFVLPTALCGLATARCLGAATRSSERRTAWLWFAAAAAAGAAASGVAAVAAIGNAPPTAGYYAGVVASLALLAAAARLVRQVWRKTRPEQLFDALLIGFLLLSTGLFYVSLPGFVSGDALLSAVFLVDLLAFVCVLPAVGTALGWRLGGALSVGVLAICAGDGLVAAASSGELHEAPVATAFLWALGAAGIAFAARQEGSQPEEPRETVRWPYLRALFPLPPVLAFPALMLVEIGVDGLEPADLVYFGACFLVALVLGFARQAYLVVTNRRTAAQESQARAEATRRNEELQALTSLAATMTESFEESAVIDRGLEVLRLGARATSAALHMPGENGRLEVRAITGGWQAEAPFAATPEKAEEVPELERRGGREVARLRLTTRGDAVGLVTLVRPASDRFDEDELERVRLLVGQLAIAIQNARAYQEQLEQAIRDPLTGVYNRRFFYEALDKEVERQKRYGSPVSLVLFDLDDFKQINDRHGHTAGDEVLCRFAEIAHRMIRPVDSFARLGGEEFGLLLPETKRLDALLVAERLRSAVARERILPNTSVQVSAGIGNCPEDGGSAKDLEKRADEALYWAKRNGKNISALASEVTLAEQTGEDRAIGHLYALVEMIDGHLRTRDHSDNVAQYATALGRGLGLDADNLVTLRRAALLHDIGKVAVPADILRKPEALERSEYAEIQRHPLVGSMIISHAGLADEARWVRHHHERIDGDGYPDGLCGDEIPIEARIIFVADAFEAMTSDRPYRKGSSVEVALEELKACAGTQFDVQVVQQLVDLVQQGELGVSPLRQEAAS